MENTSHDHGLTTARGLEGNKAGASVIHRAHEAVGGTMVTKEGEKRSSGQKPGVVTKKLGT